MRNFNFTQKEREVARQMYDICTKQVLISLSSVLNEVAYNRKIISFATKPKECPNPKIFFTSKDDKITPQIVGDFISIINFLKKLKDEKYILTCVKGETRTNLEQVGMYGLPQELTMYVDKNGSLKIQEKKTSKIIDCHIFCLDLTDDLFSFLESDCFFVLDSELIHYIENDFKTDEEIQFEKQMGMMEAELEEARNANKEAKESAEKQIELTQEALRKTKYANWIALAAIVVAAGANIVSACIHNTMDNDQFHELRKSIEASKTVEVSNEKISVDANVNVDTITVKPVDAKKK